MAYSPGMSFFWLLSCGCALGLFAQTPETLPPPVVPGVSSPTAVVPPTAVSISDAVNEALDKNLDLLAERYNLSISDTRMITAKLRPNPVFSTSGSYLPAFGSINSVGGAGPTEYNARVDFLIERGGKRQRRIDLANEDKHFAELGLRDTVRRITYDVESAFVDVLLAKENLALAGDNLRAFQEIVKINSARVDAGDLAKVELSRTRVAALQFDNAVRQAELQYQQAKVRLQQLMGRTAPVDAFDASGEMRRDALAVDLDLDRVRSLASTRRPDLQSLRAAEARSQADIRLQLAQGKIDFTIGTAYQHQYVAQGLGTNNTMSVFLSAPLPVFNRNQGEIARAERETTQWAARLRALQNIVESEVQNAWKQYQTSQSLLTNIETNMLDQAKDVRSTTEYSYRRGEASLIEFLDAQRAFNDTIQSYNQARADYARSLYLIDSITAREPGQRQ